MGDIADQLNRIVVEVAAQTVQQVRNNISENIEQNITLTEYKVRDNPRYIRPTVDVGSIEQTTDGFAFTVKTVGQYDAYFATRMSYWYDTFADDVIEGALVGKESTNKITAQYAVALIEVLTRRGLL